MSFLPKSVLASQDKVRAETYASARIVSLNRPVDQDRTKSAITAWRGRNRSGRDRPPQIVRRGPRRAGVDGVSGPRRSHADQQGQHQRVSQMGMVHFHLVKCLDFVSVVTLLLALLVNRSAIESLTRSDVRVRQHNRLVRDQRADAGNIRPRRHNERGGALQIVDAT